MRVPAWVGPGGAGGGPGGRGREAAADRASAAGQGTHLLCSAAVACHTRGAVAQLVERLGRIEEARGSIPLSSTPRTPLNRGVFAVEGAQGLRTW